MPLGKPDLSRAGANLERASGFRRQLARAVGGPIATQAGVTVAIAAAVAALPVPFAAARKGSTTARQSTTTLADDPAMAVAVNAGVNYTVRGRILFTTSILGGFKWQLTGPALTSLQVSSGTQLPGTAVVTPNVIDVAFSVSRTLVVASTAPGLIVFECNVVPSAGGTIHLQWAQGVSDASDTSVLLGSYLEVL